MSNLQRTRDNLLSVADSPEAIERINKDYETRSQAIKDKYPTQVEKAIKHEKALDAATNKMLEDNKFAKPNKNFKNLTNIANAGKAIGEGIIFGEVMGDAPKHSINEGDYNMARLQAAPNNVLSGATSAVMSAVASTGNILDAVNPFGSPFNNMSNKYLGTNLSTVSTQLLNQSADSFGNAWQNVSNLGSDSHNVAGYTNAPQANTNVLSIHNPTAPAVPQHVQTAFSTPSGFNTQQAISTSTGFSTNAAGQEIYGANKNDTLFRNDTSAESLRIQEDIALGTEFNQETSEGIQAAVERLMDADKNEK